MKIRETTAGTRITERRPLGRVPTFHRQADPYSELHDRQGNRAVQRLVHARALSLRRTTPEGIQDQLFRGLHWSNPRRKYNAKRAAAVQSRSMERNRANTSARRALLTRNGSAPPLSVARIKIQP